MNVTLTLNGRRMSLDVRANETLVEVLRERLGLRGTEEACGVGVCGSCTVLVGGRPVSSCLVLAADLDGTDVTSIEGLGDGPRLDPVQEAFLEHHAFQCGFCTAGMVMTVKALLTEKPHATREEAKDYLGGNICRCGTYEEVLAAVATLAKQ